MQVLALSHRIDFHAQIHWNFSEPSPTFSVSGSRWSDAIADTLRRSLSAVSRASLAHRVRLTICEFSEPLLLAVRDHDSLRHD